jgi:hypothetical protein
MDRVRIIPHRIVYEEVEAGISCTGIHTRLRKSWSSHVQVSLYVPVYSVI